MNTLIFLAALAAISLSGCTSLESDKDAVIAKARSIRSFPVSRTALLASLGLENQPGERVDGSIRSGRMTFSETWRHPAGLTITAYDHEFVGGRAVIDRRPIDEILNDKNRKTAAIGSPRTSFAGFDVSDGKKVLFRSSESQPDPKR